MREHEEKVRDVFIPSEPDHVHREKARARELKRSQWWKNLLGNGRCHYCKELQLPRLLTMDHIVPIIRGGKSTRKNAVPCCKDCNNSKKYLLPSEWMNYLDKIQKRN